MTAIGLSLADIILLERGQINAAKPLIIIKGFLPSVYKTGGDTYANNDSKARTISSIKFKGIDRPP